MVRLVVLVLALLSVGCAPLAYTAGTLQYVQEERAAHGLPPLQWDDSVFPVVSERAHNLASTCHLTHDGFVAATELAGASSRHVCELAGEQSLAEVPYDIGRVFVESPAHHACIDDPRYTRVAIAGWVGADGWVYEVLWLTD